MHQLKSIPALIGLLIICVGGGAAIGISTLGNMDWYDTLNQPSWTPPKWLFGPAWTTLYALMSMSMWLVWRSQWANKSTSKLPTIAFVVQLVLNFMWTPIFFSMHEIGWAMAVIIALDVVIIATMLIFARYSKAAVLCLAPYVCWTLFATTLNGGFLYLN